MSGLITKPETSLAVPPDLSPAKDLAGRAAHTATELDDTQALVVGGCTVDGCGTASADSFLVSASQTVRSASLNQARDAHTATLLDDGCVLVTGGFDKEGRPPLNSVELYNPSSRSWSLTDSMHTVRGGHVAALLGKSSVLIAGGWVPSRQYTDTTEIYDVQTGEFRDGPHLPTSVDGLAAASLLDGSVLVVGGQTSPGLGTAAASVISPDGTLRIVGSMSQSRFKHEAVTLLDGRVLVIGGTPDDDELLRTTEIYDPTTESFSAGPTMKAGRYKLTGAASVMPNGEVVVAGGGLGVEILNVAAGTSTEVKDIPLLRHSFSTVSVSGDHVRIIGGYDADIQLTGADFSFPFR